MERPLWNTGRTFFLGLLSGNPKNTSADYTRNCSKLRTFSSIIDRKGKIRNIWHENVQRGRAMKLNKFFCIDTLWGASIVFFILRNAYALGTPLPRAMFPLCFKFLLIWGAVIFLFELLPQRSNRLETFDLLSSEYDSSTMPEIMYIRSRGTFGRDERYITDLSGHVYFTIKSRAFARDNRRRRIYNVYRGFDEAIGTVSKYRVGASRLHEFTLRIDGRAYHAEFNLGSEGHPTQFITDPYGFDFAGRGGICAYD